jgi:hypothetical protein
MRRAVSRDGHCVRNHLVATMSEWQPIETAPKDGRQILAWDARATDWYLVVSWNDANGHWGWTTADGLGYHDQTLTHWMPLPFLWCAHVRGPDDMVPTKDYDEAVRLCDYLLHKFDRDPRHATDDNWPYLSAYPALWGHTPESHAEWLKRRSFADAEYPLAISESPK